ncbi:patatin-like phospholipase family protein [Ferrimonas balearica]|uniref:patatin-like phospholipase family protein n=1 Tax=Ferrimonas balearica TaxID=44012 RepID=UPI001C993CEC|nr:patatin-like phospholipase family protein [Ferrimonas balearica]MBY5921586.1 patatin-like phospholipase family protein [Ferrimonas balearica]MBY5995074.1 patatin-like phospholipase family protein [Ferrimonas balearica]
MGRRWVELWGVVLGLALSTSVWAADRPKVGLALSGGGAKGAAHVGVLRILEQHNIPVDYIAGTSMGAYVAGLYALGYSADQIEAIMLSLDFSTGFSDDIPRQDLSYRDKQFYDSYPIELKMGFREGELRFARGALQGQTMASLIRRSIGTIPEVPNFDMLPIPVRFVATDLTDRGEVILDSGNLLEAMQASMTVPGALAPIERDGQLLVDGGMVNNMPVSVVKAMGADVVIAVDIGAPLKGRDELNSVFNVLDQLSGYLTNLSRDQQVALMGPDDILIQPDVRGIGTSEFEAMPGLIPEGENAALAHIAELKRWAVTEEDYNQYHLAKQVNRSVWLETDAPVVAVRLENQSWVKDDVIRDVLQVKPGDVLDEQQIEQAIARIYSLNQFERVDAFLVDTHDGQALVVQTRGKNWGPNVFDMGLRIEDNLDRELDLSLDAALTVNNLFNAGGQWRTEANLGTLNRLATEWYQPVDDLQRFYVIAMADVESKEWNAFEQIEEFPFVRIEQTRSSVALGGGINFGRNAQLQLAYRYEDGKYHSVGSNTIGRLGDYWFYGPELGIGFDTLDQSMFPSQGQRWFAQLSHLNSSSKGAFDDEPWQRDNFWVYELEWAGATHFGAHNFIGKASFETLSEDELTLAHFTSIGGFLNLSGFSKDSLFGSHKVLLGGIYTYDLSRDVLGITWPLFLGASFEAGNVWLLQDDVSLSDLIYAGSVFVSMETAIGPAALAFGQADTGDSSFYLFIGKQF